MNIVHCTNLRLELLEKDPKKKRILTDDQEIVVALGVSLIMCYNLHSTISLKINRFEILQSRMLFPEIVLIFSYPRCISMPQGNLRMLVNCVILKMLSIASRPLFQNFGLKQPSKV